MTRRGLKRLLLCAFLIQIAIILPGCTQKKGEWTEEVQLLDGSVINIRQTRKYEQVYTGSDVGWIARDSSVSFELPRFAPHTITWRAHLHPMVLNVDGGSLYIIGSPMTWREAQEYGSFEPPYVGFKFVNGSWVRIPFGAIPRSIYVANLRIADEAPHSGDPVTLSMKRLEMTTPGYANFDKAVMPDHQLK